MRPKDIHRVRRFDCCLLWLLYQYRRFNSLCEPMYCDFRPRVSLFKVVSEMADTTYWEADPILEMPMDCNRGEQQNTIIAGSFSPKVGRINGTVTLSIRFLARITDAQFPRSSRYRGDTLHITTKIMIRSLHACGMLIIDIYGFFIIHWKTDSF